MAGSVFDDKAQPPDEKALRTALGPAKAHWDAIVAHGIDAFDGVKPEWKFYGKKHGWQMKLLCKGRALLYLIPHERSFLAGLALRESALDAVRKAKLPKALVRAIEEATAYSEGKPARVEVTSARDVTTVRKLLAVKAEG
jgi:hypothetical protein